MDKPMKMSPQGRKSLVEKWERLRLVAYKPVPTDPWTNGYGHTGPDVWPGQVWTEAEADAALDRDLAKAEAALNRDIQVEVTQHEFDALVDWVHNVGVGAEHSSTLMALLNAGQPLAAIAKQFERWDMAAGRHLQGLLNRRMDEERYFLLPDEEA